MGSKELTVLVQQTCYSLSMRNTLDLLLNLFALGILIVFFHFLTVYFFPSNEKRGKTTLRAIALYYVVPLAAAIAILHYSSLVLGH